MLHASVVSPNSIMVSWKPPLESNGRITGYKVFFTTRPEDTLSSWLVSRTTQERQHLTDLVPNATYYLKANAYNAAGDGPVSDTFPVIVTPGGKCFSPFDIFASQTRYPFIRTISFCHVYIVCTCKISCLFPLNIHLPSCVFYFGGSEDGKFLFSSIFNRPECMSHI
ncbi:unnamed protein product [Echinostoma caproni]|uniref:Fibronectin type-III domain-containing protein n=1 Tax=Echinostoma caproni TaxID=27848 RepID=A0A183B3U5_9TREM|nr:unnamed protein product [Echinostoma caproni]